MIVSGLEQLTALDPIEEASLWVRTDRGLECVAAHGEPTTGVRAAAREAIERGATRPSPRRRLVAVPLGNGGSPPAALAARSVPRRATDALALLQQAAPLVALALERRQLLATRRDQARMIVATERRLARFGLDLHDGPAQEAAALLSDLRLFASQVDRQLAEHPNHELLQGRIQDLELRAAQLEGGIRELARTAGGPVVLKRPVAPALRDEIRAFARETGILPTLAITGPIDDATASQRITLLRAIQEALRNTREHSEATAVSVHVSAPPGRLIATIEDNGRGFDVDGTLNLARRQGRIGLSGVSERARLLGGMCTISSRPGGPTVIKLELPRWKPGEGPSDADGGAPGGSSEPHSGRDGDLD